MMDDHITELIDLYALGALEPAEQLNVDRHLERCDECRKDLQRSKQVVALLAWTPDQQDPPPTVRQRLMKRISHQQASNEPKAPGWLERLGLTGLLGSRGQGLKIAPFALALALLLGVWNLKLQGQVGDLAAQLESRRQENTQLAAQAADYQELSALLVAPGTRLYSFQPQTPDLGSANGRLLLNPEQAEARLILSNLPSLPQDKTYQLWLIDKGAPVSAGVFQADERGRALARFKVNQADTAYNTAAISIEPAGGSEQPTSAPILIAEG